MVTGGGVRDPGYAIYNSSNSRVAGADYGYIDEITFTTPSTASYIRFSVVTNSSHAAYNKDTFQLVKLDGGVTIPHYSTGNKKYTAYWSPNSYTITVTARINGLSNGSGSQYAGTWALYVNGTRTMYDMYQGHEYDVLTGSTYEVKDILTVQNATFNGVVSGSAPISGTVVDHDITVILDFSWSSKTFNYTKGIQTFEVPVSGTYKLEAWGAAGGDPPSRGTGGLGGYSYGNKVLTAGDILYVVVGGKGGTHGDGGYNGGGRGNEVNTSHSRSGDGGGATHIGLYNGILKNYAASYRNSNYVYIVAGGGGGGSGRAGNNGGSGGGITGEDGGGGGGNWVGFGGTQTAGGVGHESYSGTNGGFGYGGNARSMSSCSEDRVYGGGGGAGW